MKTLNLASYGVEEIKDEEASVINGGWFIQALLFEIAVEIIDGSFFSDIKRGYSEMRNL